MSEILHKELSYKIVGCAMQVHRELGYGFLEKVYENAMAVILQEDDVMAEQQVPLKVNFHNAVVGEFFAHLLVENTIILEIKSQERITEFDKAQTLNNLKATNLNLAIILNFGKASLEWLRLAN